MSSAAQKPQINSTLEHHLNMVVGRERLRRVLAFLAVAWVGVAIAAVILLLINRSATNSIDLFFPNAWIWLGLSAIGVTIVAVLVAIATGRSVDQIAHRIETDFPDLDSVLITAIEQRSRQDQPLGFLQQDVIRRAVYHAWRNDWRAVVPSWQIIVSSGAAMAGLISLAIAGVTLLFTHQPPANPSVHLFGDVEVPKASNYRATVVPGNTEIERGTSLLVLAQFDADVPPKAVLSFQTADGTEKNISMTRSLDDPVFAGRMSQVKEPVTYVVTFDDQSSETYSVSVFDFPGLVRSDAQLAFPEFTGLPEKTLQDVRRVSAVAGTKATLRFFLNKPVSSGVLAGEDGDEVDSDVVLAQSPDDPLLWETTLTIEQSKKFRLKLVDERGRQNKSPPLITINALENQPPNLKLVEPTRDVQVSAIEEVMLQASAWDDFGLERVGISYSVGGELADEIVLSDARPGKEKQPVEYLLALEKLNAVPDQLVSWYFWAEDFSGDGQLRRTSSDMFFAEVRRFEEIYRQAQGGAGQQGGEGEGQQGGGQNAEKAMELAELQKEIINATWRIIRRETGASPTGAFASDADLLVESQQSAVEQVDEFAAELQDNQSLAFADLLKSQMAEAVAALGEAKAMNSAKPLDQAIRHEQAAYQTLLKMRAREYQVQRANAQQSQQQQQQQQRSQSQQQQQMQLMQLKEQSDQYQQERLAQDQEQQTQEQQENRQVLSRLRELAQRQNDLNKRIQELKSALEEAESETEKDEIEKQLKRLQEEQEQILRDTDELQERMQQPENQERMSEQSQQLDQARQNVQQSAEALQEGDVSRAATEGTRAERELKELRDEFQKRTSGQFNQQMRQMRNQAQDLEQQQKALEEQLAEREKAEERRSSLQSEEDRPEIAEKMGAGQQAVEDLRDQIKRTIEEAEEFEPLLADELYETYRNSERSRPDQALESARRSLQQGFVDDAQTQQQRAVEGIEELRQGIDKAAESVLGDEAEALRIARNTLEELSRQLDQEVQREQGSGEPTGERQQGRGGQNPGGQPQQDQPGQLSNQQQGGQREGNRLTDDPNRAGDPNRTGDPNRAGDPNQRFGGVSGVPLNRDWAPISGEDYREWSDRLRDVEEMIADPDLRAEAARIRDRAKAIRKDLQRHSAEPNWDLVKMEIAGPLVELEKSVTRELLRKDPKNSLIPLNREPVPTQYERAVQKYYEQLGTGK